MKKILIIEDDRALNKGITFNLKEEGFDVKGVYSLFEGRLEIEKDYDLIILDVNLPDGSGFDLCSEIKEQKYCNYIFKCLWYGVWYS